MDTALAGLIGKTPSPLPRTKEDIAKWTYLGLRRRSGQPQGVDQDGGQRLVPAGG